MEIKDLELPTVITAWMNSQNQHDSTAFAECFDDQALVFDEGKHHRGLSEIKAWNEHTNSEYNTQNRLIHYEYTAAGAILTVMVSGDFKGSPIQLKYNLTINNNLIAYLSIGS